MKQTAVEWLYYELVIRNSDVLKFRQYLEQAKEMEKQQIKDAYDRMRCIGDCENGEQYYNETFKSK